MSNNIDLHSNRLVQFMNMAVNNPTILDQLHAVSPTDHAGLMKIAASAGFSLSLEEMQAAVEAMSSQRTPGAELSEDELDVVAGGTSTMVFL